MDASLKCQTSFFKPSLTRTKKYFVRNTNMFLEMNKKDWENILDNKYLGQLCCSNNSKENWLTDNNMEPHLQLVLYSFPDILQTMRALQGCHWQWRKGWAPVGVWLLVAAVDLYHQPSWLQCKAGPGTTQHPFPSVCLRLLWYLYCINSINNTHHHRNSRSLDH